MGCLLCVAGKEFTTGHSWTEWFSFHYGEKPDKKNKIVRIMPRVLPKTLHFRKHIEHYFIKQDYFMFTLSLKGKHKENTLCVLRSLERSLSGEIS